ncbi:hypothetical protein P691DRAFT_761640 [Macrolepiota fuliginosa MF-IS2]|uniref:NACHT domain-containing protein n=1 Tax=Macrolepiota fuliginosa MF-IS2 TaxID=1400762 RepID=A0A9P6C0C8_9AGAR|nr:hypothetical protein P691DRAFT_761640 [Macrolepiota fuliginosa MF-IS2]
MFNNAQQFVIQHSVMNDHSGANFMENFAKRIIPGAEFDSSARDPPPRCHPGTRLSIIERVQEFFSDPDRDKSLLWLVGPAGVGKSAIVQTLAENVSSTGSDLLLGASLFFSVDGRSDPSKAINTLAYQIAVAYPPYQRYVFKEVTNDPTILTKSMNAQFRKFIIEPFAEQRIYQDQKPLLILIDGLDECQGNSKQSELVCLISYFSLANPDIPLIWVLSSRPEPHLVATFSRPSVFPSHRKEEIVVDSTEACADVEHYLRDNLGSLREAYPVLAPLPQWPAEKDLLKLSAAADGLFAFAAAATRFIDDPAEGNPVSQLRLVLEVIDDTLSRSQGSSHPMAQLDALYLRILSRIPPSVLPEAKRLLLTIISFEYGSSLFDPLKTSLARLCNWLGITADVAYSAFHHLHSVFKIPLARNAYNRQIGFQHKSFRDFLRDPMRSGVFANLQVDDEVERIRCQNTLRILRDIPEKGPMIGWDACAHVVLSWPLGELERSEKRILYDISSVYVFGRASITPLDQERDELMHALKVARIVPIGSTDMEICDPILVE